MFRWTVKYNVGITESIKDRSYIPKPVIVHISLVWLIPIVSKMQNSQHMKKLIVFHHVIVKWSIQLFFKSEPEIFPLVISHLYDNLWYSHVRKSCVSVIIVYCV